MIRIIEHETPTVKTAAINDDDVSSFASLCGQQRAPYRIQTTPKLKRHDFYQHRCNSQKSIID